ncbi:unnamed protein product [Rangifer tarandus platyrhynchus]|uniref:Uncharacterized protein n=2 Tax=Rangifer tarandus platyrhynchus TaxID=3082113 RepID=A0ABN9A0F8_RANTA|nr:unnamed protein product [Rangifer tarandus platyrhynchus]CAI9711239.1 unnamed protein product [Rangifer tarandus platyrhynchus]
MRQSSWGLGEVCGRGLLPHAPSPCTPETPPPALLCLMPTAPNSQAFPMERISGSALWCRTEPGLRGGVHDPAWTDWWTLEARPPGKRAAKLGTWLGRGATPGFREWDGTRRESHTAGRPRAARPRLPLPNGPRARAAQSCGFRDPGVFPAPLDEKTPCRGQYQAEGQHAPGRGSRPEARRTPKDYNSQRRQRSSPLIGPLRHLSASQRRQTGSATNHKRGGGRSSSRAQVPSRIVGKHLTGESLEPQGRHSDRRSGRINDLRE